MAASRSRSQAPPDAFDAAIRLLGVRPHGEVELRRKLARRGCPSEQIEEALERARRLGYLDDGAFARALVAHRAGGRGAAMIAAELAARGVDREVAAEALAEVSEADQVAAARRLAARAPTEDRRRLAARLQRRGFASDVIRTALGE